MIKAYNHLDVWLQGNRRLIYPMFVLPILLAILGITLIALTWDRYIWLSAVGVLIIAVSVLLSISIMFYAYTMRIACDGKNLLLYIQESKPVAVPLEIVECFFLGSGITAMPGSPNREIQTKNIVVRIAERATDWAHRDMPLEVGKWCEGHVTIRGLYCEPLTVDKVQELNVKLYEAHQLLKNQDISGVPESQGVM
jgi:hypothetical protein